MPFYSAYMMLSSVISGNRAPRSSRPAAPKLILPLSASLCCCTSPRSQSASHHQSASRGTLHTGMGFSGRAYKLLNSLLAIYFPSARPFRIIATNPLIRFFESTKRHQKFPYRLIRWQINYTGDPNAVPHSLLQLCPLPLSCCSRARFQTKGRLSFPVPLTPLILLLPLVLNHNQLKCLAVISSEV